MPDPAEDVEPAGSGSVDPLDDAELAPELDVENPALEDSTETDDDWVFIGGDVALDVQDAGELAAEVGAIVVLVAGKEKAGKTTLLVELFAQFLRGSFAGLEFAGSETLDAFDARHFGARFDSGNKVADTDRTEDSDARFLHLRLRDEATGEQRALLPTDLMGEVFEDLVDGVSVADRVPIALRADKTILIIDGSEVADPSTRQVAHRNARLLLGALTGPRGLRHDTPLSIVLSKADLLDQTGREWFDVHAGQLVDFAHSRGMESVTSTILAARPADGSAPVGLIDMLKWMWNQPAPTPVAEPDFVVASTRVFATARMHSDE